MLKPLAAPISPSYTVNTIFSFGFSVGSSQIHVHAEQRRRPRIKVSTLVEVPLF